MYAVTFAAVILAGGGATRLSGVDKMLLEVEGRTLLRRVVDAVTGADPVVVVGPARPGYQVTWTREEPPGSGPLAGLAAGLAALPSGIEEVAVLAGDLLNVDQSTVDRLRAGLAANPGAAGAVLVDGEGMRQWLIGVWRPGPLRGGLPAETAGGSLRAVLGSLPLVEVAGEPGEERDVDTPGDVP